MARLRPSPCGPRRPPFGVRGPRKSCYLKKAGLVMSPRRAAHCITPRGLSVLAEAPAVLNNAYLLRFPEFAQFWKPRTGIHNGGPVAEAEVGTTTPQESIELGYRQLRTEVESEVLDRVKQCTPQFFERLVVELLVRMGYGGSLRDAGNAVGRSGDEGIDGIIKEDKLGLDTVYIQAKRWNGVTVGRPEIQRFVGALIGQRARKGVFITTSTFSADARSYVSGIESKVVLIDGAELAALMVDYNVGVTVVTTYDVKRIDSDYFLEE
jgi:restriction system protein